MKIIDVVAAVALLSLPSAAPAQDLVSKTSGTRWGKAPSAAALQLAKAIAAPHLVPWLSRTTAEQMKLRVKGQLLSTQLATRGAPCDPNNVECRAAADAIASRHAAEYAQAVNDAVDQGQARMFEAKMSPAQIRATLAFMKTDAGKAFTAIFRMNAETDRAMLTSILETLKVPSPPFEEFYDATKNLPRAIIHTPPVIPPPHPPRRDW
jgi:hypothetical protein